MNPFFQVPQQMTEEDKRAALTNALIAAGMAMVQPQQGRSSMQRFMNALPGAMGSGIGGYTQSLLGTQEARQKQAELEMNQAYKNSMMQYHQGLAEDRAFERKEKQQEQAYYDSLPNIMVPVPGKTIPEIGAEIPLSDYIASKTGLPAKSLQKNGKIVYKWLEKNMDSLGDVMVDYPGVGNVSLKDALDLKKFYETEKQKAKWEEMGHGKKMLVNEEGDIIKTINVPTAPRATNSGTVSERAIRDAQIKAQRDLQGVTAPQQIPPVQTYAPTQKPTGQNLKKAAQVGTGTLANLQARIDAIFGQLTGERIAPEVTDARQTLRTVRQMGVAALMNSAKGAVWELKRIDEVVPNPDKWIANPKTEAAKLEKLKSALLEAKQENLNVLARGAPSVEVVNKLTLNNVEIDTLLSLIGNDTGYGGAIPDQDWQLINKYLR